MIEPMATLVRNVVVTIAAGTCSKETERRATKLVFRKLGEGGMRSQMGNHRVKPEIAKNALIEWDDVALLGHSGRSRGGVGWWGANEKRCKSSTV